MADEKDSKEAGVELLIQQFKAKGASCATVKDGHMLMFTRGFLQKLLDEHPTQDEFAIFLKRPDFKDAS